MHTTKNGARLTKSLQASLAGSLNLDGIVEALDAAGCPAALSAQQIDGPELLCAIADVTGRDLSKANDRIEFWLALRARELAR